MVGDSEITGTLHYVTDYTGFSSTPEEQTGNYLALKVNAAPEDAQVTVQFIGAQTTTEPTALAPDDRTLVFRVSNKDTQSVKIAAENGDLKVEKTYGLSGLTLEPAE